MKTYQLKEAAGIEGKLAELMGKGKGTLYLAFDIELGGAALAASYEGDTLVDLGKVSRKEIEEAVAGVVAKGGKVVCTQEACGFGYGFHRRLEELGAVSLVVAPEALNGKRKTDRADARELCRRLLDYVLRKDRKRLKVVRVPTPEQERVRAGWRQRSQFLKVRNMMAGHGRGLLQEFGHYVVPERWWGARLWPRLTKNLNPWMIAMLETHRQTILKIEARMAALENAGLAGQKPADGKRPAGLGVSTRERLKAEVLDWHRFNNRNEVGSFIGCCSSEHTSAGTRRQGSIDRMGNKRMRSMLVEAVWRLRQWNSGWRGLQKFDHALGRGAKVGPATRKKAVVACARLLAIDLWRIETGRMKPEDVGLKAL